MRPCRLAAVDAQTYWTSLSIPSDQFLLYGFDRCASDVGQAVREIRARAHTRGVFGVRIDDTGYWNYPAWASRPVGAEQIVVHELSHLTWSQCLSTVTGWGDDQVEAREHAWRIHVLPRVEGIPGVGAGTVAVLQISHALADGVFASALAAYLLGRDGGIPVVTTPPVRAAAFPVRSVRAARAHRRLVRDTDAGLVSPQADSRPLLYSNNCPDGSRHLRVVMCPRARFGGSTVTVGALAAISEAMDGHLRELGDDPAQLGAEVPMAKPGPRTAHNHFGNVGIGLFPDLGGRSRVDAIAADLDRRRCRASHPAMQAEADVLAAMPAPLLRWGVGQLDPGVRSSAVTGNTVVSSVYRGAKDLRFGDATVALTAGFPTLSPMIGVTHGVHGIGDTVAVSVYAADSAIGDIDAYLDRLGHALNL